RPAVRALLGQPLEGEKRATLRIQRQNGSAEEMELEFIPVEFHGKACVQVTVRAARGDATYAAALTQIGHQDLLTRLDNAEHFASRIEQAIRAAVQDNRFSSLLLIEIQDFADISAAIGR